MHEEPTDLDHLDPARLAELVHRFARDFVAKQNRDGLDHLESLSRSELEIGMHLMMRCLWMITDTMGIADDLVLRVFDDAVGLIVDEEVERDFGPGKPPFAEGLADAPRHPEEPS
ncbi:hypothetical protein ACQPX6_21415 [Actinomycetospora sp. CA-101289]|uniref:hypothetical protein n=1 Tax=Actinomycetospora sp. CA-101289 TaxID=3239893 RepID=UPI003D975EF8